MDASKAIADFIQTAPPSKARDDAIRMMMRAHDVPEWAIAMVRFDEVKPHSEGHVGMSTDTI